MVLDLHLPLVIGIDLLVARVHLADPGSKLSELLIQINLRAIQIDFLLLFQLRCLVSLHALVDQIELPLNPSAFLFPLSRINTRLHYVLRQLYYLITVLRWQIQQRASASRRGMQSRRI